MEALHVLESKLHPHRDPSPREVELELELELEQPCTDLTIIMWHPRRLGRAVGAAVGCTITHQAHIPILAC